MKYMRMTPGTIATIDEFYRKHPFADISNMFISRDYDKEFEDIGISVMLNRDWQRMPIHILAWTGYEAVLGIYPYGGGNCTAGS